MRCNRIFVMDHGEIIEAGTHAELMGRGGKYYELWKDQIPEGINELGTQGQGMLETVSK
ncbi:Iron import ATP-binding/permease protein IrtA [compost metagenome]